ncbi:MAG TPA: VOC family protein [Roseiflexaceae bacterium]|nr:VOC family protein [Roseiflexaceae bacterium]
MPIGTTNRQIPGCGAHHIAIQTKDWDASLHLYRDILGMPVVAEGGTPERRILLLDMGDGCHMELFAPRPGSTDSAPQAGQGPLTHIALTATDTRQAIEHVRQAGYEITVEPKDIQLGTIQATIAFFNGPNGESIEFFQTW